MAKQKTSGKTQDLIAALGKLEDLARQQLVELEGICELAGSVADEMPIQTRFKGPLKAGEYRRLHRPGRPSKIDTDAELNAFVVARIDTHTFEELAKEIARNFPRHRRVGKSALHAWWQRHSIRSP